MGIEDFNRTIDIWIKALDHYDFQQLIRKPSSTAWSIGQVYMHLLDDTSFYIEQMEICVTNDDHRTKEPTAEGKRMLLNNDFPDAILGGSPANAHMAQPESKEKLLSDLLQLKLRMNAMALAIATSPFRGKTKHPGLDYLSANEWLQFADMHLRHHLRQKKRIDGFLNGR